MSESDQARSIVAFRRDGLGGRLTNLLWSWRFGRALGVRTVIYWDSPLEKMVKFYGSDYRVSNILDLARLYADRSHDDLMFVDGPPSGIEDVYFLDAQPDWNLKSRRGWTAEELFRDHARIGYRSYRRLNVKDEDRTPSFNDQDVRDMFSELPFNAVVQGRIDRLLSEIDFKNAVAVHFRRGDITENIRLQGEVALTEGQLTKALISNTDFYFRKCAPFSSFRRKISEYLDSGLKVILFSDDVDAYARFSEHFGSDQVIEIGSRIRDLLQIQTDFVELVLLSKCQSILSTNSGFQNTARLIGDLSCQLISDFSSIDEYVTEYLEISGLFHVPEHIRAGVADMICASPTFKRLCATHAVEMTPEDLLRSFW